MDTAPSSGVPPKTAQLQIRVTPGQKAALRREARAAGCDVSTFVLARALPPRDHRLRDAVHALRDHPSPGYVLAEIHDLLAAAAPIEFPALVAAVDLHDLDALHQNYVAAMVEQAAALKDVLPPAWTREIAPLGTPYFAAPLRSLRAHLLAVSPVPFKRRNLFVDSSIGAKV
jgi:hypothetical protein